MTENIVSDLERRLRTAETEAQLTPGFLHYSGLYSEAADELASATRRAEYWKAEHLAGNAEIARLQAENADWRECAADLSADVTLALTRRSEAKVAV